MLSLEQCMRLKECGADQGTFTGEYTGTAMVYLLHHDGTGQAMSRETATQCRSCEFVALYNSDEMLAYIQQRWPHYGMIMLSGPSCDPNAKWLASTADSLVGYFEATSDAGPADALCELICTLSTQERE